MKKMDDKSGVILTGAILIITALKGTKDDIALAKKLDSESLTKLSEKFYNDAQRFIKSIVKIIGITE